MHRELEKQNRDDTVSAREYKGGVLLDFSFDKFRYDPCNNEEEQGCGLYKASDI